MASIPKIRTLLLTAIVGFPSLTPAQGLVEIYQTALGSNPTLLESSRRRDSVQENITQAKALLLPNLSAGASFERTFYANEPENFVDGNRGNINLSVVQPLYNLGFARGVDRARAVASQADADLVSTDQQLIFTVVQRYFDVLSVQEQLAFTLKSKESSARQLEQAKRRFEVGLITITDVLDAQSTFDEAHADEILARAELVDAKEALREVSGDFHDRIHGLSDDIELKPPQLNDPDEWVALALRNNPRIQSARFALESARQTVEIQRADRYPTVDITGSLEHQSASGASSYDLQDARIGVRLSVPLYEGGAISSRIRQAAFDYEASKQRLEATQREVVLQVRTSYEDLFASLAAVESLRQLTISRRSALEANQAGYEVGTRTIVDVLRTETDLFASQRDYERARFSFVINYLSLLQAAGAISLQDLREVDVYLIPEKRVSSSLDQAAPQGG